MMDERKREAGGREPAILTFVDYYLPGFLAGGPIRSLTNLVGSLGREFAFRIVTRNHDLGVATPYAGIGRGEWRAMGDAHVRHLAPDEITLSGLRQLVCSQPSLAGLYFNSFLSPAFTVRSLLLRRFGVLPRVPVLISPRGELASSALAKKRQKKAPFLLFAKTLGLYRGVSWHATNADEAGGIRRLWGDAAPIHIANNIPAAPAVDEGRPAALRAKQPGALRVAFVSRICRIKNLDYALDVLRPVQGRIEFDVYGPIEDRDYWAECEARIARMPQNVRVSYRGALDPGDLGPTLGRYHVLLLPTQGENFGHVILEAMSAGCPVVISDQTPWRGLAAAKAGADLSLAAPREFGAALEEFAAMDAASFATWSAAARRFGASASRRDQAIEDNRRMLREVFGHGTSAAGTTAAVPAAARR